MRCDRYISAGSCTDDREEGIWNGEADDIPVLGIVENYSYVKCPDCGKEIKVFGESHIDEIAADLNVPVLGKMPLDPAIAQMVEEEKFSEAENPYLEGFEL